MGCPDLNILAAEPVSHHAHRFVFVLLPGFSSLDLGAGIESLAAANAVTGDPEFQWTVVSETGGQVQAASGLTVSVDGPLPIVRNGDCIVVCGPLAIPKSVSRELTAWLRRSARFGAKLCGLGGGAITLAQAGLIREEWISTHWNIHHALAEAFSDLDMRCSIFEAGKTVTTSAGGAATLDLFSALIAERTAAQTANRVADRLLCGTIRSSTDRQTRSDLCRFGTRHERLGKAILYMESNLEQPLSSSDVAEKVGMSTRQLERLFLRYVGSSPKSYVTSLRLERARQMLQQTRLRVLEIAVACGFSSSSHFSRLYKRRFGISPHCERGQVGPIRAKQPPAPSGRTAHPANQAGWVEVPGSR